MPPMRQPVLLQPEPSLRRNPERQRRGHVCEEGGVMSKFYATIAALYVILTVGERLNLI